MALPNEETNPPIYETPDEIPIKEHIVPPINMDGLPNDNRIRKFMDLLSKISDTYPEYAMQACFIILSAIARRRIFVNLHGSDRYPVLWMVLLRPSGYARMTASIKIARKVLISAIGEAVILPEDVTREGLIDHMATKTFVNNATKDPTEWTDVSERYADKERKILRSQRLYINGEVSQLYAQMRKPGGTSLELLFLRLYGGGNYKKILVSKKQIIEDPFFPMLAVTTPEGFKKYMTVVDLISGFLALHLVTSPTYEKARKPLRQDNENDAQVMQDMINDFKLIDSVLGDGDTSIRAGFQDGALEMLDEWACERQMYYKQKRDEDHLIFIPRFHESALSMALLIELGNIPHIMEERGENKNVLLKSLKISKASMGFALRLIDSVFVPYLDILLLKDESTRFENGNLAKIDKYTPDMTFEQKPI